MPADLRPICKHDPKCYRKNPDHFKAYRHPSKEILAAAGIAPAAVSPAKPTPTVFEAPKAEPSATVVPVTPTKAPSTTAPAPVSPAAVRPASSPLRPLGSPRAATGSKRVRDESAVSSARDDVNAAIAELLTQKSTPPPGLLLGSPTGATDDVTVLKSVYGMPFDVSVIGNIWRAAKAANPSAPLRAFDGLVLVGIFEVLAGMAFESDSAKWRHWRFVHDPPEVHTIAISTATTTVGSGRGKASTGPKFHLALHRDDPSELPTMVVRGELGTNEFSVEGKADDLAAVLLEQSSKPHGPMKAALEGSAIRKATQSTAQKARAKASLAPTFHKLGFVVPYERKTELGYRPMHLSRSRLATILKNINNNVLDPKGQEELDDQYRWADIANDECDFGLNVEVGLNVFAMTNKKNANLYNAFRVLDMAYMLLNRDLFRHILTLHLPTLCGDQGVVVGSSRSLHAPPPAAAPASAPPRKAASSEPTAPPASKPAAGLAEVIDVDAE